MWIFLTATNSQRYIDVLQDIMQGYNSSYHWSIKMRPVDVDKENEGVEISKCLKCEDLHRIICYYIRGYPT